jgi:hypothetical protein
MVIRIAPHHAGEKRRDHGWKSLSIRMKSDVEDLRYGKGSDCVEREAARIRVEFK